MVGGTQQTPVWKDDFPDKIPSCTFTRYCPREIKTYIHRKIDKEMF